MRTFSASLRGLRTVIAAFIGVLLTAVVAQAQTTLTVYTAVEAEDLKKYAARLRINTCRSLVFYAPN